LSQSHESLKLGWLRGRLPEGRHQFCPSLERSHQDDDVVRLSTRLHQNGTRSDDDALRCVMNESMRWQKACKSNLEIAVA
jgi:hypothetical protein